MIKEDIYKKVLEELESFYATFPNRSSIYRAIKETLTEADCRTWFLFPPHTEAPMTLKEIALSKEVPDDFEEEARRLLDLCFLTIKDYDGEVGEPRYARNYIFKIMLGHTGPDEDSPLEAATRDWFNIVREGKSGELEKFLTPEYRTIPYEPALTGDDSLGEIPLNMEIPDTREVVTYDYVSKIVREQETIAVSHCFCRSNKKALGEKTCEHSLETCILFGVIAEENIRWGTGRQITADEALEIVRKCREAGLVQNISNAKEPTILCNCCRCCCLPLASMKRGERTVGKPSRYLISQKADTCVGCGKCASVCPMEVFEMRGGKAVPDVDKCIGCGLCAGRCTAGCLSLTLRPHDEEYLPDREDMKIMLI